ncbi:type II toxin-antitoxin system PemI/MazE family antitoxin [Lactiplantibacillus pentosus]|uniref:type II toxin-antitoxin system PemI/MazE family antitoxin n=1 Tax=Lactiplantibacillus pentosus TaxID=1589 RepID=UPI000D01E76A|nr:AbrB family transcriptional regulator [Lactiplantibacillus pentosus]MCT3282423.1 AbrB family transcriptional regulator [Lactiplantibacillus pentosus]MCT3301642.1 AbrB family transcriptional regulator [Lactiplantibacillus pentosus]PRO80095.1 AbrB family transcriptional regulator [Lactiplantibacillus pentosus]PRO82859.1 AbrB family transcriptional regulator [Lactiplantibacillus pentosus]PRO92762.1 AbrB family transcriptional regulator [Lactiplantibacillus pentosus]
MTVKVQKQGHSLMIPIPANFHVKDNAEYQPVMDDDTGILSFIPVHENIFEQNPDYDFQTALKEMSLPDNGKLVGKENVRE